MPAAPTCSAADVAAIIPERVGSAGGAFDATTTPTLTQVNSLIAQVAQEVIAACGPLIDDTLTAFATLVVATGVASQIELGFTNDLAADAESKWQQLDRSYRGDPKAKEVGGRLGLLARAQDAISAGGTPGDAPGEIPYATLPDLTAVGYRTATGRFPATTWDERY